MQPDRHSREDSKLLPFLEPPSKALFYNLLLYHDEKINTIKRTPEDIETVITEKMNNDRGRGQVVTTTTVMGLPPALCNDTG